MKLIVLDLVTGEKKEIIREGNHKRGISIQLHERELYIESVDWKVHVFSIDMMAWMSSWEFQDLVGAEGFIKNGQWLKRQFHSGAYDVYDLQTGDLINTFESLESDVTETWVSDNKQQFENPNKELRKNIILEL